MTDTMSIEEKDPLVESLEGVCSLIEETNDRIDFTQDTLMELDRYNNEKLKNAKQFTFKVAAASLLVATTGLVVALANKKKTKENNYDWYNAKKKTKFVKMQ
ncbi:hypothetical protein CN692_14290 [Bacillus sp. AFS002410]|uniref:hypothetical protein n=1 Tax=Bacillus sp. AFS002410 TaxID=2033481 RepID=UPI000BF041C9|nr:hypothetical protein [Bacillus sp. AFS002410]PEJ57063.1 hypothetical protein CN692_14290 [Bacillus sp. AFS002410]